MLRSFILANNIYGYETREDLIVSTEDLIVSKLGKVQTLKISDALPFYWRLADPESHQIEGIPLLLPFEFSMGEDGVLQQSLTNSLLSSLESIYQLDYNIGYLQEEYEIAAKYYEDFKSFIFKYLNYIPKGSQVLEIGCGGGLLARDLMSEYKVVGVDPSPAAVKASEKFGFELIKDFFPSKKLNIVPELIFHMDVLEHVTNPKKFLLQKWELLPFGGYIAVSLPDATESIEIGDISMAMHQHLSYFTLDTLGQLMKSTGFEVIEICKSNYGGSIYCFAKKVELPSQTNKYFEQNIADFQKFEKSIQKFKKHLASKRSDSRQIGFYVPLRTLPYLASCGIEMSGPEFRFFDDTKHWHGMHFDGTNIEIENFDDFVAKPVDELYIMSLTFGKAIKDKVLASGFHVSKIHLLSEIIV